MVSAVFMAFLCCFDSYCDCDHASEGRVERGRLETDEEGLEEPGLFCREGYGLLRRHLWMRLS
jgi:hypothetical protein